MDAKDRATPQPPDTPPKTRPPQFEGLALVLLSLATVGTAWCSYQSVAWGAVAQGTMNKSVAASRNALAAELQSTQLSLLDVLLFSQYLNAHASSNEPLSRFYADRFRAEARTAFDAWLATHPFENTNAPPHPFVANLYQPRLLESARAAEIESQRLAVAAGEAGRTSRSYVLITVVLATALFCSGTAPKFDKPYSRRIVLAIGLGAIFFALTRFVLLPVQL